MRAAAAVLAERGDELPPRSVPASDTQRAVLAIEIHETFLRADAPDPAAVRVAISRRVATPPP